jgi:hypothetical protein
VDAALHELGKFAQTLVGAVPALHAALRLRQQAVAGHEGEEGGDDKPTPETIVQGD